jgi:hypothetical protein
MNESVGGVESDLAFNDALAEASILEDRLEELEQTVATMSFDEFVNSGLVTFMESWLDTLTEKNLALETRVAQLEQELADTKLAARYETEVAGDAIDTMNRFRKGLQDIQRIALTSNGMEVFDICVTTLYPKQEK